MSKTEKMWNIKEYGICWSDFCTGISSFRCHTISRKSTLYCNKCMWANCNASCLSTRKCSSAGIYPSQTGVSQSGGRAQVSLTMCHPNHLVATEGSAAGPMQSATSVTYSSQGPPPTYQEKEQHSHLS